MSPDEERQDPRADERADHDASELVGENKKRGDAGWCGDAIGTDAAQSIGGFALGRRRGVVDKPVRTLAISVACHRGDIVTLCPGGGSGDPGTAARGVRPG
jgi:hypothetical protein